MCASDLAVAVLAVIHTYRISVYTYPPQESDIQRLQEARYILFAAPYVQQQPQTATIHYIASHFVSFVECKLSAFTHYRKALNSCTRMTGNCVITLVHTFLELILSLQHSSNSSTAPSALHNAGLRLLPSKTES